MMMHAVTKLFLQLPVNSVRRDRLKTELEVASGLAVDLVALFEVAGCAGLLLPSVRSAGIGVPSESAETSCHTTERAHDEEMFFLELFDIECSDVRFGFNDFEDSSN